jgi:hypothetical protein
VRNGNFFERDFQSEAAKFGGHIFHGLLRLRRAGNSRANIFGEVRDLKVGVVARKRGVAEFG